MRHQGHGKYFGFAISLSWAVMALLLLGACANTHDAELRRLWLSSAGKPAAFRAASAIPVSKPFRNLEDVASGLSRLERYFVARGDRRAIFVTAYSETTGRLQDWIRRGRFHNNDLIAHYVLSFANAYRQALVNYENGRPLPEAWRLSFDASRAGTGPIIQDLLLGINAHVNRDLPFAALDAGLDVGSERCHQDYLSINGTLREAIPSIRHRVVAIYQPGLFLIGCVWGKRIDNEVARGFQHARTNSWAAAVTLDSARSASERKRIKKRIEDRAAVAGIFILANRREPVREFEIFRSAGDSNLCVLAPMPPTPSPAGTERSVPSASWGKAGAKQPFKIVSGRKKIP